MTKSLPLPAPIASAEIDSMTSAWSGMTKPKRLRYSAENASTMLA